MITPTVGRVVWFTPAPDDARFQLEHFKPPFAAHIAYVWGDRCVNLMAITPQGEPTQVTSVELIQEGDVRPVNTGRFCEWMPYQVGQAKKHDAEAKLA